MQRIRYQAASVELALNDRSGSKTVFAALKYDFRGRDASYLAPPAQNRASGIPARGSHLGCLTAKRTSGQG